MKSTLFGIFSSLFIIVSACSTGQNKTEGFVLAPTEFNLKMKANPEGTVLDVRTPEEFSEGALPKAINVDWNGSDFESGIAKLDKKIPVFVYCLAGSRSASAAKKMRKDGFTQVFELEGGIIKWRAAGIPEDNSSSEKKPKGMSKADFEALLDRNKTVLVDFYAEWCGPCKKMKPDLEKIALEQKDKVNVLRIDADVHQDLAKELGVDALPTIFIYKNKQQTQKKTGYQTKEQMIGLL
jgi:thioredoxin 1